MADYYNLYGYLNLFPGLSGFLYPVFQKNGTLYLADGDIHHIFSFHPLKPDYITSINPLASYTNTLYCAGCHYPHIYQKENGQLYIGSEKQLFDQLRGYQLTNPVLQEELDDFLSELNILCAPLTPYYGTGRRKKAVARVFLYEGTGKITINHRKATEYFTNIQHAQTIQHPFLITSTSQLFDAYITVKGGGIAGQAGAIRHGISRALLKYDLEYRTILKAEGFLTRDSRMKERKKPGMKGARKSPQFSKR